MPDEPPKRSGGGADQNCQDRVHRAIKMQAPADYTPQKRAGIGGHFLMPAKGKTKVNETQRSAIAAGRLTGKTAKEIARSTGLGVRTVEREVTDPRTQTYILRWKDQHAPQMQRMFGLMLDTMERDLKSKDVAVCAAARAQFLRLLPLGDPPLLRVAPADNSAGDFTLEELLACYAKVGRG